MLDFSDLPYQFFPPKRNALIAWMIGLSNRWHRLPNTLKVDRVDVSGLEGLRSEQSRGSLGSRDRIIFLPNHPTHTDAAVFIEAIRQAGFSTQMMAAYDVFLRSRLDAWVMQKMGAFSVDREGSDQRAMKQAAAVLTQGKHALTIFPEGNVYLRNDQVTPFNDGAAFLAIRAAKELSKQNIRVLAVPVSIKLTHLTDCRAILSDLLEGLGTSLDVPAEPQDVSASPREAIVRVGVAAVRRNLTQRGLTPPDSDDLAELIEFSVGAVLDDLETKLGTEPKQGCTLIDRVRSARRVIHEVRTDEDRLADHAAALTWADQAMLAFRICSYLPDYVAERPTLDRVSETIEKLGEDVRGTMIEPIALRRGLVRFNHPIPLDDYIGKGKRGRQAISDLTAACEASVQKGVDELNNTNPHPGGKLWGEV
jgi:1-acyl-sn-glycerol-3-phosphate acyltransferase